MHEKISQRTRLDKYQLKSLTYFNFDIAKCIDRDNFEHLLQKKSRWSTSVANYNWRYFKLLRPYLSSFLNRFTRSRALDYSDGGKFVVVRCELHKTIMNATPTQIYFTPVSRQRAVLWHDNNYLNFFLKYAICATASDSSRCFPFAHYINFSKIFSRKTKAWKNLNVTVYKCGCP